jgi:hypothetical protein
VSEELQDHAAVYRGKDGWRWRAWAAENGVIIGKANQGYSSRGDALDNLARMSGATMLAPLRSSAEKSRHAEPGSTYRIVR